MYLVYLKEKYGEIRKILIKNHTELFELFELIKENRKNNEDVICNYSVEKVEPHEYYDIGTAFIKQLKKQEKPEGLEYGRIKRKNRRK